MLLCSPASVMMYGIVVVNSGEVSSRGSWFHILFSFDRVTVPRAESADVWNRLGW